MEGLTDSLADSSAVRRRRRRWSLFAGVLVAFSFGGPNAAVAFLLIAAVAAVISALVESRTACT